MSPIVRCQCCSAVMSYGPTARDCERYDKRVCGVCETERDLRTDVRQLREDCSRAKALNPTRMTDDLHELVTRLASFLETHLGMSAARVRSAGVHEPGCAHQAGPSASAGASDDAARSMDLSDHELANWATGHPANPKTSYGVQMALELVRRRKAVADWRAQAGIADRLRKELEAIKAEPFKFLAGLGYTMLGGAVTATIKAAEQPRIRPEFALHMLSEHGVRDATSLAVAFSALLDHLDTIVPGETDGRASLQGRARELVIEQLQGAAFWAERSIAIREENQRTVQPFLERMPADPAEDV